VRKIDKRPPSLSQDVKTKQEGIDDGAAGLIPISRGAEILGAGPKEKLVAEDLQVRVEDGLACDKPITRHGRMGLGKVHNLARSSPEEISAESAGK